MSWHMMSLWDKSTDFFSNERCFGNERFYPLFLQTILRVWFRRKRLFLRNHIFVFKVLKIWPLHLQCIYAPTICWPFFGLKVETIFSKETLSNGFLRSNYHSNRSLYKLGKKKDLILLLWPNFACRIVTLFVLGAIQKLRWQYEIG